MKKHAEIVSVIGLVLVLLFFAGCKTVPSAAAMADPVDFLPDDADIYFRIDVRENTSLLTAVVEKYIPEMAESDRVKLINMLHTVYVAQNSESKQIFVAATGSFPNLKSLAFTKKNGWKEIKNNMSWSVPGDTSGKRMKASYIQYVHDSGMEIAFPEKNLVFFSNGSLIKMQDKHVSCMIHGEIEHNDVFPAGSTSKPIVFCIKEPEMQTLGLSILNTIIGNISLLQGNAKLIPLSETVAEKPVQTYSINCSIFLRDKRALIPVRLLVSKVFSADAGIAEDGSIVIKDYLIEEEKLLTYLFGDSAASNNM